MWQRGAGGAAATRAQRAPQRALARKQGSRAVASAAADESPLAFPEKKLNGKHLDLYGLYKQARQRLRWRVAVVVPCAQTLSRVDDGLVFCAAAARR